MNQLLIEMLGKMVQIRTVEELIGDDFIVSKIFSFLHLSVGQEGSAVGVGVATEKEDLLFGNHRSHGHYLGRGGDLEKMIREVYGDIGGCCGGYGGSMHMLDRSKGFAGSTPILGSAAPIGVGLSFSQKIKGNKGVAVVFIGDGAAEEGAFYESINLAGLFQCPLIFILEDNRYCVNSPHKDRKASKYKIQSVIEGLGASYHQVDGQKVWMVYDKTREVRKQVLDEKRPAVIHVDVLRVFGHSGPLKEGEASYRHGDDLKYLTENDCIKNLREHMFSQGISMDIINEIESKSIAETKEKFLKIRKTIEVRQ